jgi:hypothetical protein
MSDTTQETKIDYNGLWIAIGIGVTFLILFSVLLFFYLRYRKNKHQQKQRKRISSKALSIANKDLIKAKVDFSLYCSNNRSDNRLIDDLARPSAKDKDAFSIFTQTIKNDNIAIQIKQEITEREGSKIVSIKRDDINIEIMGTERRDIPATSREVKRYSDISIIQENNIVKEYHVKQVLCYTDGQTSEQGHSMYKEDIQKLRNEYYEMKHEESRARKREEELEHVYDTLYVKKEKSTADDEKQTGSNIEVSDRIDNEFKDEDMKTVNNLDANKLAVRHNAIITDFSKDTKAMPEIYKD